MNSNFDKFSHVFISVFEKASATAEFYKIEVPIQSIISQTLNKLRFKGLGEDLMPQAVVEFYKPEVELWNLFPDTMQTLVALREGGFEMGLISNAKSDWLVQAILDRNQLREFFKVIVTSAEMRIRKPRAEIFERALKTLGIPPSDSAFLGDSMNADVLGARLAGMRAIHVRRRPSVNNLVHADATVNNLSEALKQIMEWKNFR